MVKAGRTIALLCLGLMALLPDAVRAQNADLEKVIAQLDAAAAKFSSAQADFTWDQFTAAVQDDDLQTGTIYFERKKKWHPDGCLPQAGQREACAQNGVV